MQISNTLLLKLDKSGRWRVNWKINENLPLTI